MSLQLAHFRATEYRNVLDSGWIEVSDITAFVGQNEAGRATISRLSIESTRFVPMKLTTSTKTGPSMIGATKNPSAVVCQAKFVLTPGEIESLYDETALPQPEMKGEETAGDFAVEDEAGAGLPPPELMLIGSRSYTAGPTFAVDGELAAGSTRPRWMRGQKSTRRSLF